MASLVVNGVLTVPAGLDCVTLAVSTSAVSPAALAFPAHQLRRIVVQTDQPVRWTAGDVLPTSTFGLALNAGETLVYDGTADSLNFIRASTATANATLTLHYFGLT